MSGRFRRWGMIAFVVFAGFICRENTAQAAMAQISLQKSADEIVKSDIFYVVITVAADEEITGFDGYFPTIRISCSILPEAVFQAGMTMRSM